MWYYHREYDQYKAANAHIRGRVKGSVKVLLRSYFLAIAFCLSVKMLGKYEKKRRGQKHAEESGNGINKS